MAQLELSVVLNLANFRTQLGKLAQASAAYYYPVNLTIDQKAFKRQLAALGNIKTTIKINDSQLDAARARVGTLNKSLATLRRATSTPIEIKLKYVEVGKPSSAAAGQIGRAVSGGVRGGQVVESFNYKQLQATRQMMQAAKMPVGSLGGGRSVEAYLNSIVEGFKNASEESINGLASGLKSGNSEIATAAKKVGEAGVRAIKDSLGIASPSRVFKQIGEFSVDGLELGFLNGLKDFKSKSIAEIKKIVALMRFELAKVSDLSGTGGPSMGSLRQRLVGQRAYTSPIGPLPVGSRAPYAQGTRGQFGGSGYEPRMVSRPYGEAYPVTPGSFLDFSRNAGRAQQGSAPPTGMTPGSFRGFSQRATNLSFPVGGMAYPSSPVQSGQSSRLASPLGGGYFAVGKGLKGIESAYGQVKNFLNTKSLPVTGAIADLGSEFGNAIKQVLLFGTAYKALAFLTSLPGEAFEAAKGLATYKNQLQAVTAESGTFEQSFAFVDGLATRFNVPLDSVRQGFIKLYASMQPAGFDQGQIENLFTGISKAAAAFGLSSDKVDRVNYAFAQMASKGQIMSEELKGQLGDVLPGALGLFAKAAQMSIPEFSQAMEDGAFKGKAMEQVLGNVATLLNNQFGAAAEGAAKTLQGAVNQIQNNLALMYQSFAPIVDGVAAAFGPQVNALIKDVTNTVKVLTTALTGGGSGFETLSPRAQAFYNAIKTLEPALRQAGAALADMGNRLAQLAPLFVEVLATAISFASSPLARAALIAAVAIGTLTAALRVLEVTGLKAALKTIYSFISSLMVGIPQATGVARVALISLKVAVTGLFVGAILLGLDFLIGKILDIGGAAQKSVKDVKQLAIDLDRLTGAQDMIGLATKRQEAGNEVVIAERLLEIYQKVDRINKEGGYGYGALSAQQKEFLKEYGKKTLFGGIDVQPGVGIESADKQLAGAMERRGMAQKSLETAQRLIDQDKARRDAEDTKLTKIDLSGEDEANKKKTNLESYYSLQDQLAKAQTQADIDRIQAAFEHRKQLINNLYDLEETRANSIQKEAIAHQRAISDIFLDLQSKQIDARLSMMKAEGSVAGGAPAGSGGPLAGMSQYITGDPSHPSYKPDHGTIENYHDHLAFASREAAIEAYNKLTKSGIQVTEFQGFGRGVTGPHSGPGSAHHKGLAMDVPGAQWGGSGAIGAREFAGSARVRATLGMGGGAGATPGKVTPDRKRDVLAEQAKILAGKQAAISLTHAEVEAQQKLVIETEKYLAQIFGIAEKELQTSMLQKKTAMLRAGATDQEIEDAMSLEEINLKYTAGVEAANKQIAANNKLIAEGSGDKDILNKNTAAQLRLIARLNEELPKATKAQTDLNEAQKDAPFLQRIKDLKEEIKLLLIINTEERRLAELTKEFNGDKVKAQEIFDLEKIKKNIEATRALIGDFVSSTSSDYKGFLKAVISGEDAVDALKQFQEGLKDRVLTIFLDFAMAPVEKFMKESLEGLFLPKAGNEAGGLPEATTKDPVEATNINTTATNTNTTELKNLTTAIQGMGAGTNAAPSVQGPTAGNAFSPGGVLPSIAPGFDAGSVFGNPEALTGAFAGIQSSISTSMEGITSSFQMGADSLANTLPSWSDSLTNAIPAALTTSTDKTNSEVPNFKESLGKVAAGIGIAAGTIMGIAAGISQIKEGGTANVLGGIGSILTSVGGGIGGFTKLFGANGGVAGGGWKPFPISAFANGGMVTGPTLGLVGEGKYNEAIVPLPDGKSIPVQMRGGSSRDLLNAPGSTPAAPTMLSMSFQSTTINGVEYVDRAQLEAAMAETRKSAARDGASRGASLALDKLQNSPSARRRIGIR